MAWNWASPCIVLVVMAQGVARADASADQRMIELVRSGKIKVAHASWWGFDPEDSTDALQAAINTGVRKVIVDNPGKPWAVRPIELAGGQTIVFANGVEVIAKQGEFRGTNDCLFAARNKDSITLIGYGATLRMRRSDYAAAPYEKAEWRHVLSFKSCSNVKIHGLTLSESGGDGIYLGTEAKGVTNKNVRIRDVTCERNYRQGISVITAENLLIENTVMRDTAGTAPQAGIDFEPNHPDERLVNVIMRDCVTKGNKGDGYELYLRPLNAISEPVSIRFENCRSIGDNYSARVVTGSGPGKAVTGSIEFVGCTFERGRRSGVAIADKPVEGCRLRFGNCSILDTGSGQERSAPILVVIGKDAMEPVGGVEFDACLVRDSIARPVINRLDALGTIPVRSISGTLILERDGKREDITLTPEMLGEWH